MNRAIDENTLKDLIKLKIVDRTSIFLVAQAAKDMHPDDRLKMANDLRREMADLARRIFLLKHADAAFIEHIIEMKVEIETTATLENT